MAKNLFGGSDSATRVLEHPHLVVVVVTHDPGSSFPETLTSLARQDYGSYRVLVIEDGETAGLEAQVHEVIPDAEVHQLGERRRPVGWGAAANEVLAGGCAESAAAGAEYLVFCHDDVVLDPTALTALVETSSGCGADIVGPKLVDGDDPRHLLEMGQTVTATGAAVPLLPRGEFDQGQYDGRREVFAVTGGAILVRASSFRRIGGFDEAIGQFGDDLSLCWRARLTGGRVVVTSTARARLRVGARQRVGSAERSRLLVRHRVRLLLTCYGRTRRLFLLPLLAVVLTLRGVGALVTGRTALLSASVLAWPWNLWHWRSVRVARKQVKQFRRVRDRELRDLKVTSTSVLLARWRDVSAGGRRSGARGQVTAAVHTAPSRRGLNVWTPGAATVACVLVGVVLVGSRHLLTRGVPEIGQLLAFDSPRDLYREWATGWRRTGLGSEAPVPSLLAALAGLGPFVLGKMDLLRTALTAGLIPVGAFGAFRALRAGHAGKRSAADRPDRPAGSPRAGLGAAVAYLALPLPYLALTAGDWPALATYAAAPWPVARLLAASKADGAGAFFRDLLSLGVLGGILALVVPAAPWLLVLSALGLALGGLLAFELRGLGRQLAVAGGAAVLVCLLQLPWTVAAVRDAGDLSVWWGLERRVDEGTFSSLLPLDLDESRALWALLGAAAVALLVGRGWRLGWAIRGWGLAGVTGGAVWAAGAGELGLGRLLLPAPDLLLVLGGVGVALAVGCGVAAIEQDVVGRSRRFGVRRLVAAAGLVALGVASVPTLHKALDGNWGMATSDYSSLLTEVEREVAEDPTRVLWVGHPDAVPGDAWTTAPGDLVYTTTLEAAYPRVTDLQPGPAYGPTQLLDQAIEDVRAGETARVGRDLAPMAVRYIAVPLQPSPSQPAAPDVVVPQDLLDGLAGQLDLQRVTLDPSFVLYRNLALRPETVHIQGHGRLPGESELVQSVAESSNWRLTVDGVPAQRQSAFGWANAFVVAVPGWGELGYVTPWRYTGLVLLQGGLWLAVVGALVVIRARARAAASVPSEAVRAASRWHTDSPPAVPRWITLPQDEDEYVRLMAGEAGAGVPDDVSCVASADATAEETEPQAPDQDDRDADEADLVPASDHVGAPS